MAGTHSAAPASIIIKITMRSRTIQAAIFCFMPKILSNQSSSSHLTAWKVYYIMVRNVNLYQRKSGKRRKIFSTIVPQFPPKIHSKTNGLP